MTARCLVLARPARTRIAATLACAVTVLLRAPVALALFRVRAATAFVHAATAIVLAGAALALAGHEPAFAQAGAVPFPQPKLPVVRLQAGIHVIQAELADTGRSREVGLMGREALGPNEGMLFVFDSKAVHCFWMRNTPLPLSIAFLDDDGRIVDIAQMAPRSDDSHCPRRAVRFALEMEQGWFARHGIAPGARLMQPSVFPGQR